MINLSEDYKLDADKHQYILFTRKENEKDQSKESWGKTFHPTIDQVARSIADKVLRESIENGVVDSFHQVAEKIANEIKKYNEKEKG